MKKLLLILSSIVLTFALNAQTITMSGTSKGITKGNDQFSGFQATFSYDQIESTTITGTERGTFSAISIEGAYLDGELGTPQLPVFKKMIAIPVDATPTVVVKNYTSSEYALDEYGIHTLFPAQADVRKDQDQSDIPFAYNVKAYGSTEYTNAPMAHVEILGTTRGVILGMLTVNPIQYNPATNSIMVYNNINVEVTFENGNYQKTQALYRNTYSPYFSNLYKTPMNRGIYEDHPDMYKTPVHMLVIANRMFESALQPWLEWKTKKGFYVDVNYTDVIGSTAAAIKAFCHSKYNQGTTNGTAPSFIVFVGDTPQVPASQTGSQSEKATDLYYAKVNTGSTWFPDMYYSRLSAQNVQQLTNQIEKILYYEKYQFADPSYLDKVLLIAGADGTWNPRVGQPTINYAANYYFNAAHGYTNVHKYLNSYSGCYANFNDVGFANYTAHCSENSWGDPSYTCTQVSSLTNVNKYFIAMGNCCLAADFGWTGANGIPGVTGECFGETMMREPQKGTAGYIGSSPSSYWGGDFHFAVGAYSGSINTVTNPTLENTTTGCYDFMFGDADFNTLCSYIYGGNIAVTYAYSMGYETHVSPNYYWEAYNVLGDGSLMPYNTQADDNTVTHLPVIYIGLPSYEVMAVPGSLVAISKDGVLLGTAVANESGVAMVTIDPPISSGGNVDIVVTRNQYKPVIEQVPAVAQSGPYVVPAGYTVPGDEKLTYISTNTEIEVTLNNVGIETTTNLTVTISCSDPQLTITNNTATCSGIAPNGSAIVKFNVTVAHDIPDNKTFMVDVTSTEGGKGSWEGKLPLKAYAPVFTIEKILIDGVDGGNLSAGTVTTITTVVKNKGGADAYMVKGNLEIGSEYINFACEGLTPAGQNLPAGETMELPFTVITSPNMPYGHEAPLKLLLSANYGISASEDFKATYSGSSNYCIPGSTNCSVYNDRITSLVIVKTSDQSSVLNTAPECSSNGYTDYTSTILPLVPGEQYTVKVKVGYQNHRVRGWVDANGNNLFDNAESLFTISCSSVGTEYTANFTVPTDAAPGVHRFRIRTRDGSTIPEACDTYSYGQTLDYSVNFPELYPRVQNVHAELVGENITVTWEAPATGTPNSYNIYRNGTKLNTDPVTVLNFTETNIVEGVYAYNVTAVYGAKESYAQMSNVICNIITCKKPVNLEVTPNCLTAKLTWEEPEGIEGELLGYNIYRNYVKINEALVTNKEYLDENLEAGEYKYQVSAKYADCESDLTNIVSLLIQPCEMPQNLNAELVDDFILVSWDNPLNINRNFMGFNVYRNEEKINTEVITEKEYKDEDLVPETEYCYQVSAVYSFGESEKTDPKCLFFVSIKDYQDGSFSIYPNPTTGELNLVQERIENGEWRIDNVEILDVYGRKLSSNHIIVSSSNHYINISHLSAGIYFVKITTEAGAMVKKVVKM